MQTFLPYPDFAESAAVLDPARLGKQRVETLQILRALELPDYGWRNHPAVVMWRGYVPALVRYGIECIGVWTRRGFGDSTLEQILEFAPDVAAVSQAELAATGRLPGWVGDPRVHASHRSKLLAKDPAYYRPFFPDDPVDLDYFWPAPGPAAPGLARAPGAAPAMPDAGPAPTNAPVGTPLWVLRPESTAALGHFLLEGVVGFGTAAGIDADVTGLDLAGLRALPDGQGRRRPTRPLVALAVLVNDVRVGDEIAALVEQERALLVGRVRGDYEHAARDDLGARHRRRVRWDRVEPRAAVTPPSSLQDVRPLFQVRLAPAETLAGQDGASQPRSRFADSASHAPSN